MSFDPLAIPVGTLPHVSAAKSMGKCLAEGLPPAFMEVRTLGDALSRRWPTPALFCGYYVEGETSIPRLAKRDERVIVEHGGRVLVSVIAIDYDLPKTAGKKSPWPSPDAPWTLLEKLADTPELWPTAFYSTLHGARLVYALKRSLPTVDAERLYSRLLDRLEKLGIHADDNTADWTRFFALPFITKPVDGGPPIATWEDPTIFCEVFSSVLDPNVLLGDARSEFSPCVIDGDKPTQQQCDRLLWIDEKRSPAHARARELLKNNSFAAYLFDGHACDFQPGERDAKLNAMSWSVVRTLMGAKGLEEIGPDFVFAVVQNGVSRMHRDDDEPEKDWTSTVWEKICRIWEQLVDEHALQEISDDEIEQKVMLGWHAQLVRDGVSPFQLMQKARIKSESELLRRHLIAATKNEHYLMDAEGNYRPRPVPLATLHGAVEMMGLSRLYGLHKFGERVNEYELRREIAINVDEVVGSLGESVARITGLGTSCVRLLVPTYYLIDIEPLYVQSVDDWLHALAGEQYERLSDWIGHAQTIDRPICALSLTGAPGAGKSFLAELLAARFGPGGKNNEGVFGQWNFRLRDNPIVHIDEGINALRGAKDIDARFRELVTGGNLMLSQKNVDDRSYEVYPRVVITANNLDALHGIVANRDLDDYSHDALAERVLHLVVDETARQFVKRDQTENWIRGDQLALRHFAWLHQKRQNPSLWRGAGRFLVEGDRHSEMLVEARFSSPLVDAVQRVLIKAIEAPGHSAVKIEKGYVPVSATQVCDLMNAMGADFYEVKRTPKSVGASLRRLSNGEGSKTPHRTWHVPIEILLRLAIEIGAKCDKLRAAYESAFGIARMIALERGTK